MTEVARQYRAIREMYGGITVRKAIYQEGIAQINRRLGLSPPTHSPARPHWDGCTRTLSYQGVVLKRYRRNRAENQTLVLEAFEELEWPCEVPNGWWTAGKWCTL
jgi:hypothetical protein